MPMVFSLGKVRGWLKKFTLFPIFWVFVGDFYHVLGFQLTRRQFCCQVYFLENFCVILIKYFDLKNFNITSRNAWCHIITSSSRCPFFELRLCSCLGNFFLVCCKVFHCMSEYLLLKVSLRYFLELFIFIYCKNCCSYSLLFFKPKRFSRRQFLYFLSFL